MHGTSLPPFRLPGAALGLAVGFALLVLFIQEGISYYLSVQTVALFYLIAMVLHAGVSVRFTTLVLAIYMLFAGLLICTAALLPDTISQNSPNILVTTVGVLGHVALILAMISVRPLRAVWLLQFYRRASATVIVVIVALVAVTDFGVVPGLTRENFIFQNVGLITNYTTMDVLEQDQAARRFLGVRSDIDLFYGEQSFLSLVIFVSLVSNVIASRALNFLNSKTHEPERRVAGAGVSMPLVIGAVASMLYIQSFSSLFFAAIVVGFLLTNVLVRLESIRFTAVGAFGLLLLFVAASWVAIETAPYYLHRLTTFSDSLSAQQRFGVVLGFLPQDFLLGLHERGRIPPFGFHNGLIYIVMMAGVGGLCLLVYLIHIVVRLAAPLRLATLSTLAVLAVFSQNGAILSPNKLVVLSFLLIPLVCAGHLKTASDADDFRLRPVGRRGATA